LTKLETLNLSDVSDVDHAGTNATLSGLTRRWTFPVLQSLGAKEPARFNELKRSIEGISATSLSERLAGLEKKGIVERMVYPETPPRVEYIMTKKGWEFYNLLNGFTEWATKWDKETVLPSKLNLVN
jgi:DNA-binding HxlR family transcriptional regulator